MTLFLLYYLPMQALSLLIQLAQTCLPLGTLLAQTPLLTYVKQLCQDVQGGGQCCILIYLVGTSLM